MTEQQMTLCLVHSCLVKMFICNIFHMEEDKHPFVCLSHSVFVYWLNSNIHPVYITLSTSQRHEACNDLYNRNSALNSRFGPNYINMVSSDTLRNPEVIFNLDVFRLNQITKTVIIATWFDDFWLLCSSLRQFWLLI